MPLLASELPLFAEVLDHPDDPAPRLVLADAMLDRGEPYGEYLLLSNGSPRFRVVRSREKVLREGAARTFLGPIDAVCSSRQRTWRHGLLSAVMVKREDPAALAASQTDPLWGTVSELTFTNQMDDDWADLLRWAVGPVPWRWLRTVHVGGAHQLEHLLRANFPSPIAHVAFFTPDDAARLGDPAVWPVLRELHVKLLVLTQDRADERLRPVHRRAWDRLGYGLHPMTFARFVQAADGTRARALRFSDRDWQLDVDPSSWAWIATALRDPAERSVVHGLMRRLDPRFRGSLSFGVAPSLPSSNDIVRR